MKPFIFLIMLFSFSNYYPQEVSILNTKNVTGSIDTPYYFPVFLPGDESILVTQENYKGLFAINLRDYSIESISDEYGAGYEPKIISNGNIFFRRDSFRNNRKYTSLIMRNLYSKKEDVIKENTRFLTYDYPNGGTDLVVKTDGKFEVIDDNGNGLSPRNSIPSIGIFAGDEGLILFRGGEVIELYPMGRGAYVWPSLSPDRSEILFTFGNQGIFVSDPSGNLLSGFGYGNAPKWSPDGEWIVYMKDYDDGYNFIASDIFMVSRDGTREIQITDTRDIIEMYPQFSFDGNKIIFHSLEGDIFITELNFE